MPGAARVQDPTDHPGMISGQGVVNVLINGQAAAVVLVEHTCMMPPTAGPHSPSPIVEGSATVLIGGRQAARVGDRVGCGAAISDGSKNVLIG